MARSLKWWVLVVLLVAAACGGRSVNRTSPSSDPDRITFDELRQASAQNAYQAIQQLRPNWFQVNSPSMANRMAGQVVVYVDGSRMGGVDFLRQVAASSVEHMQYMNATEASARFGLNHSGGAILVTSRRR